MNPSPELRVFISSTFLDLHEEREHLVKKIFPELKVLCRQRGVELTEIDLRWGISHEESKHSRIIRTCLDEISHYQPVFIGIVGSRYGWVPTLQALESDPMLEQDYPWIRKAIASGMSLTEMEIRLGAFELSSKLGDTRPDASFYFRAKQSTQESEAKQQKLESLRERIRMSGLTVHENVASSEELGELVHKELIAIIDRRYPAHATPTPLEQERSAHDAFRTNRRRAYVATGTVLETIETHTESSREPLVICGRSGIGKSAVLAEWSAIYEATHPVVLVIPYFVGITSTSHHDLLRRVMQEIRTRYAIAEEVPHEAERIVHDFARWLGYIRDEKLVLVIDAINQLDGAASDLHWLPRELPPQLQLVLSVTDGPMLGEFRARKWRIVEMNPLTVQERRALIALYLGRYRKSLTTEQSERIARNSLSESPLFLTTLLEELRLYGSYEHLNDKIEYYLESNDLDDLFKRMLERLEADYGKTLVRDVLLALWASRRGLSEAELLGITKHTRLDLSRLLLTLEFHLLRRQGVVHFFHSYLSRSVERRYVSDETAIIEHQRLAQYFASVEVADLEANERQLEELPWQLLNAQAWSALGELLTDPIVFEALFRGKRQYELVTYWRALSEHVNLSHTIKETTDRYVSLDLPLDKKVMLLNHVGELLMELMGRYADAEKIFRRTLILVSRDLTLTQGMGLTLTNLGRCLQYLTKYADAEEFARKAVEYDRRHLVEHDPEMMHALTNLAWILGQLGKNAEAESIYQHCLDLKRQHLEQGDPSIAFTLRSLSYFTTIRGAFKEAEALAREAIAIDETTIGRDHVETAWAYHMLGLAEINQARYESAKQDFQQSAEIFHHLLGRNHPDSTRPLNTLVLAYYEAGELEEAENLARRVIELREESLGKHNHHTAVSYSYLAPVLRDRGKLDEAEHYIRRAIAAMQRMVGKDHAETVRMQTTLGSILARKGKRKQAVKLLRESWDFWSRTMDGNEQNAIRCLIELAEIERALGNTTVAMGHAQRASALASQVFVTQHPLRLKAESLVQLMGSEEVAPGSH